ncbi:MAG: hypothetical protein ACRC0M_06785 [Legionella sp.]
MPESQQLSIKLLNAWLKNYPQGLSFMQRLLLCMDLYKAYGKAKSTPLYSIEQKLIVRTLDYCNINVTGDGLSLTSSIEATDRKEQISNKEPVPCEETTCEDDDQLSLALLCAELLGYPHVAGIITRAQLFYDVPGCFKPEELLTEFADCNNDVRETLSIILLLTAAKLTKRTSNEPKKVENVSGKSYDIVLLAHCRQLTSSHCALNTKLDTLRIDLDNYYSLNDEQRSLVHQEYIAADFLMQAPEAINTIYIKPNETLAIIWRDYCQSKLTHVNTQHFEQDTPQNLLSQTNKIKALCTHPMQPNPAMLQFIIEQWAIVVRLSQVFQHLKHYNLAAITSQFNAVLSPDTHHSLNQIEVLLKSQLQQLFNNQAIEPLTSSYQQLYDRLCNDNNSLSTCFTNEWLMAQQLMQLYQLCHQTVLDKNTIPEAQDSFDTSFNELYLCYQNYFIKIINTGLNTYKEKHSRSQSSRLFQKAPQRADAIMQLFDSLRLIFQNSKDTLYSIRGSVISCVTEIKTAVEHEHKKGLGGALNLTQSELANALSHIITALANHDGKHKSYSPSNNKRPG